MDAEAYADMLPWLVFLVIDRRSGLGVAWAGGAAAIAAAMLAAWSYWRGRRSPLLSVALVVFGMCFVAAITVPAWDHMVVAPRAATVLVLSAVAFVSLGFTPITDVYTTPVVAPRAREDRRFRQVNVEMTVAWGVGALLVAAACAASALVHGAVAFTFCDWVVPLVIAAGTTLWAARRWELFRLAVDAASTTTQAASASPSATANVTPGAASTAGFGTNPAVSQLHPRRAEQLPTDAVIRKFPARGHGRV